MRIRVLIPIALFLLFLIALLAFLGNRTPQPVAFIKVVDPTGAPVAGATIVPDGLRPKKGGGHYGWTGDYARSGLKPVPVQTDADGFARVIYPFYVDEKLETGEISFAVDHPDFCADRPFRVVASSPPQNASFKEKGLYLLARLMRKVSAHPDPVVLQPGATVEVTGYIGTKENVMTNIQAEISRMWPAGTNFWRRSGTRLWTRKASAGKTFLRAVHLPSRGPAMFSDAVVFDAKPGQTNQFHLELKPGLRVLGRVDDIVPRPVRDGHVCIHVYIDQQDGNSDAPIWFGSRLIEPDGSFVFDSLPPGRLEIMGLCDGFVSKNGPSITGVMTAQRLPQTFDLQVPEQNLTLAMEPAATCAVTILNDAGQPLSDATAMFWPNILWGGNGSTLFGSDIFNSEDLVRDEMNWTAGRKKAMDFFRATTDERGVALVRNLPPGRQNYAVRHTNYDMPIVRVVGSAGRSSSVALTAGATGQVAVTMQKKGTETLTH